MKLEQEITVLVTCNYDRLDKRLREQEFNIKEEYTLTDDYMIDSNIDINSLDKLDILKKCVLIRDIIGIKKVLLYKYKKYNQNGDILEQGKVECPINDLKKAKAFMEAINYKTLFKINDKCIVYDNNKTELIVQLVNDKYICIELEAEKREKSLEELKQELDSYNLPYNKNNYFVKKAELMLDEILKKEND